MIEPSESRRRDDASIRLEQEFKDFIIGYREDKQESIRWRESHDARQVADRISMETRLKPLEDLHTTLKRPAQIIGAILIMMFTPILGVLGWDCMKWLIERASKVIENGHP